MDAGRAVSARVHRFLSPFSQVAGEVLPKADDAPVLSFIDPLKSLVVGQGHLHVKNKRGVTVNTLFLRIIHFR